MADNAKVGKRGPKAASVSWDASTMTMKWSDGVTTVFDQTRCNAETNLKAMQHGYKQKIGDAAAIEKDENGQSASVAVKREAVLVVIQNLYDGKWVADRDAGGANRAYVFEALVAILGADQFTLKDYDAMLADGAKTQDCTEGRIVDEFSRRADVSAEIAKIKAARGIKTPDADSLLTNLKASLAAKLAAVANPKGETAKSGGKK